MADTWIYRIREDCKHIYLVSKRSTNNNHQMENRSSLSITKKKNVIFGNRCSIFYPCTQHKNIPDA